MVLHLLLGPDLLLVLGLEDLLELGLLLSCQFIRVLEELHQLGVCELDVTLEVLCLTILVLILLANGSILSINLTLLLAIHLLLLLLLQLKHLLLLLWSHLFEHHPLLLRVSLFESRQQLVDHELILLHLGAVLLDTGVNKLLAVSFLVFRRNLIDYLFVLLGILLILLGFIQSLLVLVHLFTRAWASHAFQGREEVVQKDALAWLDLLAATSTL